MKLLLSNLTASQNKAKKIYWNTEISSNQQVKICAVVWHAMKDYYQARKEAGITTYNEENNQ